MSTSDSDRAAIMGRFKSAHNASDSVAERQATTFLSLLKLADISNHRINQEKVKPVISAPPPHEGALKNERPHLNLSAFSGLRYNIAIHLPATKDVEVYTAIFKSLKEHLLDD